MSARLPVLVALAGLSQEQALVAVLDRPSGGTQVVRRCVDLADLLGAASTRTARVAVVAADLRRLDREALEHLTNVGLAVVGVTAPGDDEGERRLRQLGVLDIVRADTPEDEVIGVVLAAPLRRLGSSEPAIGAHGMDPAMRDSLDVATESASGVVMPAGVPAHASNEGTIIAVWGPTGAPGRTTVAVTLAAEAAHAGVETLLVDADTYGSSIAQVLGLLDEAPGLAAAARAANSGRLDVAAVARAAREVTPRLRVLTGFARSDRWPELRASSLEVVLEQCRWLAELTVVDVGFCLEQDEELVYDTAAPRRNGATLATLSVADTVVAVGSADPVGLQRLLRALPEVRTLTSGEVAVVINRARRGVAGGSSREALTDLVVRHAGVTPSACLPEDRTSCDLALAAGRSLTEVAPRSALRTSLAKLASQLVAQSSPQKT